MSVIKKVMILSLLIVAWVIQPIVFSVSPAYRIIDYKGGATFAAYLTENHEIYVVGSNNNGQLGRGYQNNDIKMNPTTEPIIGNVKTYTAGKSNFIIAITNDNRLFGWGSNQYGQLGQMLSVSTKDNDLLVPTPIAVDTDATLIDVAVGARHSLVLDSEGQVWAFGDNAFGQLGMLEEVSSRTKVFGTPTKIDASYFNNQKVIQIASSEYTSYALVENGDVYAWGTDYQGQLVLGDDHDIALLGTTEKMINYPVKTLFTNVEKISAHSENIGVLTRDQRVYIAGSNTLRQLGVPSYTDNYSHTPLEITNFYTNSGVEVFGDIVDLEIGGVTNFILLDSGHIFSFGSGGSNELGYQVTKVSSMYRELSSVTAPTQIIFYETVDVEMIEDIETSIYKNAIPVDKTKLIDVEISDIISSSGDRTILKDKDGNYWSFGNNSSGMAASGNVAAVDAPVSPTLYRVEFYDEAFITKNYLIEPLIGVILTLILFAGIFTYLEINLRKQRRREKRFIELLNSNEITTT